METSVGFIIFACITGLALIGTVVSPIIYLLVWAFTGDEDRAITWLYVALGCSKVCMAGCAFIAVLSLLNY